MTISTLKGKIKSKFGSLAKFAKLIKVDRYELQKFFAAAQKKMTPERKERIDQLAKQVRETKNEPVASDLTPELRKKIREAIEEQHEGVTEFCTKFPEFNQFSVWQIIHGRRKTISAKVKKLLQTLNLQQ